MYVHCKRAEDQYKLKKMKTILPSADNHPGQFDRYPSTLLEMNSQSHLSTASNFCLHDILYTPSI